VSTIVGVIGVALAVSGLAGVLPSAIIPVGIIVVIVAMLMSARKT
jgi:hypothetical protein